MRRALFSGIRISLYIVVAAGASGHLWSDYYLYSANTERCWETKVLLDKDTPFEAIFDKWPGYEIAFVDLRENTDLRIPWQMSGRSALPYETSISEVLDGIVMFEEVKPVRTSWK